jgi:hypothetical protein
VRDVQLAADVLRGVYDDSDGLRRLRLARGRAAAGARHRRDARAGADVLGLVDRPNLMIKIPATPEGIPAIETALYEGHERQRHAAVRRRPYET